MPFPPDMKVELADAMAYERDEQDNPIPPPPRRMTEQEFLAWTEAEDVRAEWCDGIAYELVPPNRRHQEILGFLMSLLYVYVESNGLGWVIPAGFEMRLRGGRSYRLPDILFVATEHKDRLNYRCLDGPADLVVEIVGDDTAERDLRDKFIEYAVSGFAEYWIIDPRSVYCTVKAYALTADGGYKEMDGDDAGRLHSIVITGFCLEANWLAADAFINPLDALRQIAPKLLAF